MHNCTKAQKGNLEPINYLAHNGFCKHETCGVKNVHLTLKTDLTFELIFNGTNIKHQVGIKAARPIRGRQREIESKKLLHVSASVEYAKKINVKLDGVFVAKNRDNWKLCCYFETDIIRGENWGPSE